MILVAAYRGRIASATTMTSPAASCRVIGSARTRTPTMTTCVTTKSPYAGPAGTSSAIDLLGSVLHLDRTPTRTMGRHSGRTARPQEEPSQREGQGFVSP